MQVQKYFFQKQNIEEVLNFITQIIPIFIVSFYWYCDIPKDVFFEAMAEIVNQKLIRILDKCFIKFWKRILTNRRKAFPKNDK